MIRSAINKKITSQKKNIEIIPSPSGRGWFRCFFLWQLTKWCEMDRYLCSRCKPSNNFDWFFDRIKNQFYLQIFSGYSIEAVRQDFFAAILLHNLQSIAIKPAQEAIEQENRQPKLHKDRKYLQQINRNTTLGIFKIFLLELLTYPPEETKALFEMLNIHFRKQKQPIRKGRQFPRKKQMKKRKNTPGTAIHQKRAFW